MKRYTVLVLRPDYERIGPPSEWVFQAHVFANKLDMAKREGIEEARRVSQNDAFDYAILAVYSGFLTNLVSNF